MPKYTILIAGVFAVLANAPTGGWAQAYAHDCKPNVTGAGQAALTQRGAIENAEEAWQHQVIAAYGELHADYKVASLPGRQCARTAQGLWRCQVTGSPCEVGHEGHTPDSGIGTTIWEVQQLLNDKDYRVRIDGILGPYTKAALRQFQRDNGLRPTGLPDAATIEMLRA